MQGFLGNYLIELGHLATFAAFILSMVQAAAPWLAARLQSPALARSGVMASYIVLILMIIGGATLIHAFVIGDFSVKYVASHSNAELPLLYKVTALWGGHEGSLFLWAWILAGFTAILAVQGKRLFPLRLPVMLSVQACLLLGFLGLILFLSNPFERLLPAAIAGRDLNPLLQDPGMAFHPPMLYFGYVGFSIPFAFAMTAILTRWETTLWIGLIRRWTLFAWTMLTIGIMLGGWWAYYELGWGGYWAWDPVENASFMPWLLGTALVHSITVQENRRMLQTWNLFLAISTFALSLLGTFLVRSGVLSSVHAFAVDPGRGVYILLFMVTVLIVAFGLFLAKGRIDSEREAITSLASREMLFVFNNVLFSVLCLSVLVATLYPLALDAVGEKITIGVPYFNSVMIPLFFLVIFLMGVAPATPWRKVNLERLWARLWLPTVLAIVATITMFAWDSQAHWFAFVGTGLVTFVLLAMLVDFIRNARRRAKQQNENIITAWLRLVRRNRRYYGGMFVHFGILVIAIGMIGSGLFRSEQVVLMAKGDVIEIGGEKLRFDGVKQFKKDNYFALQGQFALLGTDIVIQPERRKYPVQEAPTTESGIDSNWARDVYVVIGEIVNGRYSVHAYVNPLVQWIWAGGFIIVFGIAWSLSQRLRNKRASAVIAETQGNAA